MLIGDRVGALEVLARLGEGGMAEVYKARDTRLDRDAAIEVLPPAFAAYAERIARLEREAKTLASLNHPRHGADLMQQGAARGNEWRTMPLWGVSERGRFLHDGRALTVAVAVMAHGGHAQHARDLFAALAPRDKAALLVFLNGI
jgi:serine/threonine protein kinase